MPSSTLAQTPMPTFSQNIRPHIEAELQAAYVAQRHGKAREAFKHLERAHVLGQAATLLHVRAHAAMLAWAWRERQVREALGQLLRLIGAATKTALGWVPHGNTGGANVSPFRPMPVPRDLAAHIERARGS